ncbi:hypothetical protein D3C81_464560 [compost metagenome]
MSLIPSHFHMLDSRRLQLLTGYGVFRDQPEQLFDGAVLALVCRGCIHGKPFNAFIIPIHIVCKNIPGHRAKQRIQMLVHEISVGMLESFDDRIDQIRRKIGRIRFCPQKSRVKAVRIAVTQNFRSRNHPVKRNSRMNMRIGKVLVLGRVKTRPGPDKAHGIITVHLVTGCIIHQGLGIRSQTIRYKSGIIALAVKIQAARLRGVR